MTLAVNHPSEAADGPLVLVTGGAGFIGSHTVDTLMTSGFRVVVLDNFCTGKRENLSRWFDSPSFCLIESDLTEDLFGPLAEVNRRLGPFSCVVHLAAQTVVSQSIQDPLFDAHANYLACIRVLEYAKHASIPRVLLTSSSAIYGDAVAFPTPEEAEKTPLSPYGINKLGCEHFCRLYSTQHGIQKMVFRLFNVYGPGQVTSSGYSGVISIFARQALENAPITIFGDGLQQRDFVYVSDVARILAHGCMREVPSDLVVNICSGSAISIRELAQRVVAAASSASPIRHGPARPAEIRRSCGENGAARRLLSFNPQTPIDLGLRHTLDWMRGRTVPGS